jgi:tetratricopeptide (TPR) repeat protein
MWDKARLANSKDIRPAMAQPNSLRFLFRACLFVLISTVGLSFLAQSQTAAYTFADMAARADAARQQGDIPAAIRLYKKATEMNSGWPDGWWFLGILQYDENQYVPALDALNRYLQLTPNAAPALALKGLCEFNTGEYLQSLQDLELGVSRGAANQPRNARIIFYHEALALMRVGRFEESLGKFTLLAGQGPDNGTDNQDLAISIGLAGLRKNLLPKDAPASQTQMLSSIGQAALLLMNQNYEGGQKAFQTLFAQYPQLPGLHYLYGYLIFASKPDEAVEQFGKELQISPRSANAHAMRAWALELRGDYTAALEDATKASTEDSSLSMGQLVYGRALVETGEISAGLPHLENVLRTEPANLEAHLTLAKAYSKLGRSEEARRERLLCLSISQQGAPPVAAQ